MLTAVLIQITLKKERVFEWGYVYKEIK